MKTRNSLVSNSSSSSFILIGIPIGISQLSKEHICSPKGELHTIVFGGYIGEGQDIFTLTEEGQLNFIKDHPDLFSSAYLKAKYIYEGSVGIELKKLLELVGLENVNKLVLIGGTADQNSSYTTKAMIQNYENQIKEELAEAARKLYSTRYGVKDDSKDKG